jgi:DNA ligase-1
MKAPRIQQRPMKAHLYEEKRVVYPCFMQFKKDGLRAYYIDGYFYSGDGKQWNDKVVAHLLEPLRKIKRLEWLDGEFYRHGWPLQRINSAIGVNRVETTQDTAFVQFHVFDCINSANDFIDRLRRIKEAFRAMPTTNRIRLCKSQLVYTPSEAHAFHAKALLMGYEGTIYRMQRSVNGKHVDEGYVGGRVHWMLKRKEILDAEFKIVGMNEGRMTDKGGKHVGRLGALICVTKTGKKFQVGSGYSDEERDYLWKHPPVGKTLRVKYRVLSSDGTPLEPRSMGVRDYA